MELVAASKMRAAQERMHKTRPYADKMREVLGHIATAHPEYRHPYLEKKEKLSAVGLIVLSTDRGLCGGLNTFLFKKIVEQCRQWESAEIDISFCTFGGKAQAFFKRLQSPILASLAHLADPPFLQQILGSVKVMLDDYEAGKIDALYIAYNRFVNTMRQEPIIMPLLPISNLPTAMPESKAYWDYIYEPDATVLLDNLFRRYIETQVFQALLENMAGEQAARMIAMKNATDNAGNMLDDLKLIYNKARQASITREIAEIVSGSDAI